MFSLRELSGCPYKNIVYLPTSLKTFVLHCNGKVARANSPRAITGVCRQLSSAYLNSSNADVLPSVDNASACQTATPVTAKDCRASV
jgi:hypothetical protein